MTRNNLRGGKQAMRRVAAFLLMLVGGTLFVGAGAYQAPVFAAADPLLDSRVFDWRYYLNKYRDLREAGISTEAAAQAHWLAYGINEGRQASPGFHARQYLDAYADLRQAFGPNNYAEAIRHYITFGWNEGRFGAPFDPSIFNWAAYVGRYSDLRQAGITTEALAKAHWMAYGIREGRQAMYGFHWTWYRNRYPDVVTSSSPNWAPVQAIRHWQYYGIEEGRVGTSYGMPLKRAGIFYLGWHTLAASAMNYLPTLNPPKEQLTVEDIVRRRAQGQNAQIRNILYDTPDMYNHAWIFHYQVRPTAGFYCLYRPRAGETTPTWAGIPVRDCGSTSQIARQHADQLAQAGIDYVVVDATNIRNNDSNRAGDLLQLRPLEVLFEEWQNYRNAQGRTPQIAVFATIDTTATNALWRRYLDIYNNPAYGNLVMRDQYTGKKIFFAVDNPASPASSAVINEIKSNGGRNDVVVVEIMWAKPSPTMDEYRTHWWFLAPCIGKDGNYTTDIPGIGSCNQRFTLSSPVGSSVTVAASYQLTYASHLGMSSGRRGGLTFEKQFARALEIRPDYLFIVGWNEFIAQPISPNTAGLPPGGWSPGLEGDLAPDGVPDGRWAWTDDYAAEYSRDIEPTIEYGANAYNLMRNCLSTYRRAPGAVCKAGP